MNDEIKKALSCIKDMTVEDAVTTINEVKEYLKSISPFANEPVECVQWVKEELVIANDYNPNTVAPPEMELLHTSIQEDGYTQPIVVYQHDGIYEVVDGFHRNRVGKEYPDIHDRIHGYLPVTVINDDRHEKADRIASTIRHNRARGKHRVEAMSDIVIELKRRNWSDKKIGKELGMDADEVLRLTQITGLAEMWTTHIVDQVYNCYPIYDWRTADDWIYQGKNRDKPYNELYDYMHLAGLTIHQMRICQPYGDDQRRGLWLFHLIEPQTWAKVVARVNGANSGAMYINETGNINGYNKVHKPQGHTWHSFALLLINSMPPKTQEHYKNKIYKFVNWWKERGYPDGIPDEADYQMEQKRMFLVGEESASHFYATITGVKVFHLVSRGQLLMRLIERE